MKQIFLAVLLMVIGLTAPAQNIQFQPGDTDGLFDIKFSPDDSQLISYGSRLCLWDVASGRLIWMTETGFIQKAGERHNLTEFRWSVDNKFIITKCENGTYQTWDAKTGKILSVSEQRPDVKLVDEKPKHITATRDHSNYYLSDSENEQHFTVKYDSVGSSAYDISHDGKLLAQGGRWRDGAIRLTDVRTGTVRFLDGHPSIVDAIAYSPDGKYLAVGGSDKNIYVFDTATHVLWKTLTGHTMPISSVAFSPDGKILISSAQYELMKAWDWQQAKLLKDIKSEDDILGIKAVAFSPDGKYFLTTSDRDEFRLWDAHTFELLHNFKTPEEYQSSNSLMTIEYDGVPPTCAVFSRDSRYIYSGHEDGTVRVWDVRVGKQVKVFKIGKAEVSLLQVNPDGKTFLAATKPEDDTEISLYGSVTGRKMRTFDKDKTDFVERFSISPDGQHFSTSDVGGVLLLWKLDKKTSVREFDIGFSENDSIAFSPDGKTLAVGGMNQNLFLFDVETGKKLFQLIPPYHPNELETRLEKERSERRAVIDQAKAARDKQAATDTAVLKRQVYITFEHYGDMTDPGQKRIMESDEPKMSKASKSRAESNAVWLRLHNDSDLPIYIPTQSMYMPNQKCFYQLSNGNKAFGLCDSREIDIWFGLEDKNGKSLSYGFDFGSSSLLLPKTSAVFAVPLEFLKNNKAIIFSFTFQKEMDAKKLDNYGEPITLKYRGSDLPK